MTCRECAELVTEYLDGALPAAEHARLEAHLGDCPGCTAYLESIRATVAALGAAPDVPADPHVREHLLAAYRRLRG